MAGARRASSSFEAIAALSSAWASEMTMIKRSDPGV
jgi:hypothetical protein